MSLLRTAIVLSCAVALLPSDKAQQERLYATTASAVQWTATFCDRNAQTCAQAAAGWDIFRKKAEFAMELAFDAARRYAMAGDDEAAPGSVAKVKATPGGGQGTLTPDDLKPAWRAKVIRQGI